MNRTKFLHSEHNLLILTIVYSIALFCYSQHQSYLNPYVVADDTSQHTFWMYQWMDNGFNSEDPIIEMSRAIQPWGYTAIYKAFSIVISPIVMSKILPVFLFVCLAFYSFKLIANYFGPKVALFSCIIILSFSTWIASVPGGHARAFSLPLIVMGLYYLQTRQFYFLTIITALSAWLYPVAFLLLVVISVFNIVLEYIFCGNKPNLKVILLYSFCVGSSMGILTIKSVELESVVGQFYQKSEVESMPEFGDNGRISMQRQLAWKYIPKAVYSNMSKQIDQMFGFLFLNRSQSKALHLLGIFLLFASWFYFGLKKLTRLDLILASILLGSVTIGLLAQVMAIKLYMPSRYMMFSLPVFFALLCLRVLMQFPFKFRPVLIILLVIPVFNVPRLKNLEISDYSEYEPVYEFFKTSESEIIIAGPPRLCDQIPLFSRRSVLFSFESSHAVYFVDYWEKMKSRTAAFWEAYLCEDREILKNFIQEYDVDYIIIDNSLLNGLQEGSIKESIYFEPFDTYIKEHLRESSNFYLLELGHRPYVQKINNRYSVLNCRRI